VAGVKGQCRIYPGIDIDIPVGQPQGATPAGTATISIGIGGEVGANLTQ
jgi:hypothetical protein